jgi:hypothetical protein
MDFGVGRNLIEGTRSRSLPDSKRSLRSAPTVKLGTQTLFDPDKLNRASREGPRCMLS